MCEHVIGWKLTWNHDFLSWTWKSLFSHMNLWKMPFSIMKSWCWYYISPDLFYAVSIWKYMKLIRLKGPEDPHHLRRSRDLAHASIPLAQTPWGLTGRAWLQAGAQRVVIVVVPPIKKPRDWFPLKFSNCEIVHFVAWNAPYISRENVNWLLYPPPLSPPCYQRQINKQEKNKKPREVTSPIMIT